MTKEEIAAICEKYYIKNHTINDDMSVDVNGDVSLWNKKLTDIPLNFRKVTGDFYCSHNSLSTLKNCPNYVGGDFECNVNRLTSLHDLPVNFHVGGTFRCDKNNIKEAKEFGKLLFCTVGKWIDTGFFMVDEFLINNKNPPKKDLPRLLSELRKIQI